MDLPRFLSGKKGRGNVKFVHAEVSVHATYLPEIQEYFWRRARIFMYVHDASLERQNGKKRSIYLGEFCL